MSKIDFSKLSIAEICAYVGKYAQIFEEEYNIRLLYGQVSGGRRMGLSGMQSDNDFDLFYEYKDCCHKADIPRKIVRTFAIKGDYIEVEFNLLEFQLIVEAAKEKLSIQYNGYPTVFYRDAQEFEMYSKNNIKPRQERTEYLYTKYHYFIFSDHYLDYINDGKEFEEFYKNERLIDAIDYYFVRAYGNYKNYFLIDNQILTRRYLNCIWQVLSCEWILKYKEKAPLEFTILCNELIKNETVKEKVMELYDMNKFTNLDKSEIWTVQNSVLNDYINKKLNELKVAIECIDNSKLVYDLYNAGKMQTKIKKYVLND